MTQFAIFATLLIVVVAAFILPPLWLGLRAPKPQTDRKEANLAIFRDQLAELGSENAEGSLAEADFEQAKRELQRRLLEEVEATGRRLPSPMARAARRPSPSCSCSCPSSPCSVTASWAIRGRSTRRKQSPRRR
jgi:cytochrome c-type biogenesis protein CcmI